MTLTPVTSALVTRITALASGYGVKLASARSDGEHDYVRLLLSSGSGRKFAAEGYVDVADGTVLTNAAKPAFLRRSIDSLVGGA